MKTKVLVDDFPAGPRLDAEVARIPGWTELRKMEHCDDWKGKPPDGPWYVIPRYSSDIGAAWKLVEMSIKKGLDCEISIEDHAPEWTALIGRTGACPSEPDYTGYSDGDTAPLAIARAFLKASGVKEIEVEDG